jgi:hypothetical protein
MTISKIEAQVDEEKAKIQAMADSSVRPCLTEHKAKQ